MVKSCGWPDQFIFNYSDERMIYTSGDQPLLYTMRQFFSVLRVHIRHTPQNLFYLLT